MFSSYIQRIRPVNLICGLRFQSKSAFPAPSLKNITSSRGLINKNDCFSPPTESHNAPLTGVAAGRTVDVMDGNIGQALKQLNNLVRSNNVAQERRKQRFYLRPSKAKAELRMERNKRRFGKGFKRLLQIVNEAKRKGY